MSLLVGCATKCPLNCILAAKPGLIEVISVAERQLRLASLFESAVKSSPVGERLGLVCHRILTVTL